MHFINIAPLTPKVLISKHTKNISVVRWRGHASLGHGSHLAQPAELTSNTSAYGRGFAARYCLLSESTMILCLPSIVCTLLFLLFTPRSVHSLQCYFPDGKRSPDSPCNTSVSVSACCPPGWACLNSNVCGVPEYSSGGNLTGIGATARGSCTDSSWTGPPCPGYCTGW